MAGFPDADLPVTPPPPTPSTEAAPTVRMFGGLNLNDRVNTFFRKWEPGSTRVIVVETPADVDGSSVVTRLDRKARDLMLYILFKETTGYKWETFQENVENVYAADFTTGDGLKYQYVYTVDCTGQQSHVHDLTVSPPLRYVEVTIKATALNPHRVAA